nr:hypothetical protein [Myxococcota bacterium]
MLSRSRLASVLAIAAALASASTLGSVDRVRADPDPADQSRSPAHVHEDGADDADLEDGRAHPRFDYSRFSDGPRRVPTPRGASKSRAEQLALGTRDCASQLLH